VHDKDDHTTTALKLQKEKYSRKDSDCCSIEDNKKRKKSNVSFLGKLNI
jgi:hypothetical protein